MGVVIGIVIYAIIAYITCPRKENGFGDLSYM